MTRVIDPILLVSMKNVEYITVGNEEFYKNSLQIIFVVVDLSLSTCISDSYQTNDRILKLLEWTD